MKILKNIWGWCRRHPVFSLANLLAVILIIVLLILISGLNFKAAKRVSFTVYKGETTWQIGQKLFKQKLIKSPLAFYLYIKAKRIVLQSGSYTIEPQMTTRQIVALIHSGKVNNFTVTIPEGYRATQIDELLAKKGIIKSGEFTKIASSNEGYLFPDTYELPLDATAQSIRSLMMDNFAKKTAGLKTDRSTIILASIIEREARLDQDRAPIAGVYTNRLKIGMKLDADPTVQYAKGNWNQITRADYLNINSAYNTYKYAGLPPGPICNPGLKSIQAALNPAKSDYLYFFHTKDGRIILSKTFEEHQRNLLKN